MKPWWILCLGVLLLTGCNQVLAVASDTPTPTLPPVRVEEGVITVEGVVEPEQWIVLHGGMISQVTEVLVHEGESVATGDVLIRLDTTEAEIAIKQAEAALAEAQAQLALVEAPARPEYLAVLEAQIEVADANISSTLALRDQHFAGGTEIETAKAQAQIAEAASGVLEADTAHDETLECITVTLPDGTEEDICPALGTFEELTRYRLEAAQAQQRAAQTQLEVVQATGRARTETLNTEIAAATAQRDVIQAELDLARVGTTAEEIAIVEARIQQANVALETARAALDAYELDAPFAGIVTDLPAHVGDTVLPETPLVSLATVNRLHIRTKDLTELDIAQVSVGATVNVTLDARPDVVFEGHIVRVDRQGEEYLGDVVYPVFIKLDKGQDTAWLRWGMTAQVKINAH